VVAGAPYESAVRWRRALLLAFALVVASFLTETVVSQILASTIDEAAERIVTDYSPSVVALAIARSELHRMQDFASDYVDGGGRAIDRQRLDASRAELDRATASYMRLPFIPGERELWERVADDMREVHATSDRTVAAVAGGDTAAARRLVSEDLRTVVDRTSADILSNIELNATAADDDGRLIARRRRTSLHAAVGLAVASVGFTTLIALLIYRLRAQHDDLQRRHAMLLADANAELEIFASRLSHDILSPLASTRLALDSALHASNDVSVRRTLQRGASGLDRAARIAQSLFDFARAGARANPAERGDVRAVVSGVVEEYRPLADEAGARLEARVPDPAHVACNEGLLTSALSNLVRNAIKHLDGTPDKRVDILAVDAGDRVRIEVRDTGPGLAPGVQEHLFEPYVRGPEAKEPGLGLGLATVKRIVETHGGAVGVESRTGAGCRFWMELPKASVWGCPPPPA
jgi:signal transduction histidine kinase